MILRDIIIIIIIIIIIKIFILRLANCSEKKEIKRN